jgi:hypothetical protein
MMRWHDNAVSGCDETSVCGCDEKAVSGCDEKAVPSCDENAVPGCDEMLSIAAKKTAFLRAVSSCGNGAMA